MGRMNEISRLYPSLSMGHVRTLADIIATQRNGVAAVTKVYAKARWGFGCLAYQVVKECIETLSKEGVYPWLRYVQEAGLAYTAVIDGVPMRIQPDDDVIRDVMPGERREMRVQSKLPNVDDAPAILRLEVAQVSGHPVDSVTLYLFDEHSGMTLDSETVYRKAAASETRAPETGTVLPLTRRPQELPFTPRFTFNDPKAEEADDDGSR